MVTDSRASSRKFKRRHMAGRVAVVHHQHRTASCSRANARTCPCRRRRTPPTRRRARACSSPRRNRLRDKGSCGRSHVPSRSSLFQQSPTVPITVAPRCFDHWHRITPTPAAAVWMRTVSPRLRLEQLVDDERRGQALQHASRPPADRKRRPEFSPAGRRTHCAPRA